MYSREKTIQIDRDKIWHPFTQMKDYQELDPPVIVKGKGIFLEDAEGRQYYDTISSWWTNTLGHCNKEINKAIKKQIKKLEHVNYSGFAHPYSSKLVDRLSGFLPESLTHHFFSDDGSTAVEVALKMAFQYWQNQGIKEKTKFVMLENAYHGDTLGAMSVGGVDMYHKLYSPLMCSTYRADSPNCSSCSARKSEFTLNAENTGCSLECFQSMENILRKNSSNIAAVIVEPLLQAAGGMLMYPPSYLQKLRTLTDELDIILIFDEVATGFGRTGTLFAYESAGVIPDIICLSKGLTAGYMPLAMTICTDKIYRAFYDDYFSQKTFYHGHSYTANPLACAIASKNLKILRRDNLPGSRQDVISHFHNKVRKFQQYSFVKDIRTRGFVGAIDLVEDRKSAKAFDPAARIGWKIYQKSLENGLVLRPLGDMIYWFLPLITTIDDIDVIMDKSNKVIREVIDEYRS